MKPVYLSGPMSGIPEHNFPLFNSEAARLRSKGVAVVNPVDVNPDATTSWEECLRKDLIAMMGCDTIAVLPGWEKSRGAILEVHVASALGMRVVKAAEL